MPYRLVMSGNCVLSDGGCLGFATTRFSIARNVEQAVADGWRSVKRELEPSLRSSDDLHYEGSELREVGWLEAVFFGRPRRGFTFYDNIEEEEQPA